MINASLLSDYLALCKPKVVLLMLITTWVGMYLASNEFVAISSLLTTTMGIGLAASSAAIINHLIDRNIDAKMSRTELRPIASGRISVTNAIIFATCLAFLSFIILYYFVNKITTILTFCTLIGYAFLYTIYLKRATPQNIVIGGLSGAMPPLLGWAAVSGDVNPFAWLLVLIIFTWTPPHFWALAIYRHKDYMNAKIPMLPVTHGIDFTKLCILLYTILLCIVTILPILVRMSGIVYLSFALPLNVMFMYYAIYLFRTKDPRTTHKISIQTFNFSVIYLLMLFIGLLADHFVGAARI